MRGRVALCHEWVTTFGGSEQVAARLAHTLDTGDVYTFAADRTLAQQLFGDVRVHTSRIGTSSFALRRWPWLLPFMGRWWRSIDFSPYDLVVTSSHAAVNSIRVGPGAAHVSYCHTPMRYAWNWQSELGRIPRPARPAWPAAAAALRRSDRRRAQNVDLFIANSQHVQARIRRYYGRPSVVIYPPVDTSFFCTDPADPPGDAFLYAGRLVAYKRPDIAVLAANRLGVPIVVAGSGPELGRLRALAGPTISFHVDPSREDLRRLYRRARALVVSGVEDFGMVLVEAQACGTPVIARAEGGALEAVRDGVTGKLFAGQNVDSLAAAMSAFDAHSFDRYEIQAHARGFDAERFDNAIRSIADRLLAASPERRRNVIEELLEA